MPEPDPRPAVVAYLTADVHAPEEPDGGAWKHLPGVAGDALHGLAQVARLCARDQVPLVIAGDVFDGPDPDPRALSAFYAPLREVPEIQYVLGNHDRGRDWLLPLGPRAVRLDGRVERLRSGATVTGLSFHDPARFRQLVGQVPAADVGVYHQTFGEWAPGGNRLSVTELPAHALALCGDVHVAGLVRPPRGPKAALSPGPLCPQSVAEFGAPARAWALHDDLSVSPVLLRGRRWVRLEVSTTAQAEEALAALSALTPDETLPEPLRAPMVSVRLAPPDPDWVRVAERLASERGVVLRVAEVSAPAPAALVAAPRPPAGFTLTDAIAAWPAAEPVRRLAHRLTAPGTDPAVELRRARAEYETEART